MLDENLPAFFFKKSTDGVAHHTGVFCSYRGSDPNPAYIIKHGDPVAPTSRNCYAAGLFDCHNTEVLYGEVLITPEWTQPSLSQEEIRRNNGHVPQPQPILPTQFTVQLYNPDLQVMVTQKPGSWGGSASYEFSLPQLTFRTPSASTLDRTQDDPAASLTTPKLNFVWRKESKLAKDLSCYMTGRSTDQVVKKKHRDPDITIALFRSLRELTIYEPNLYRVELEDPKGLELVLLLTSAAIKDIYFTDLNQAFNISTPSRVGNSPSQAMPSPPLSNAVKRKDLPRLRTGSSGPSPLLPTPPTTGPTLASAPQNPSKQHQLDAETARLRAQIEAEEREEKRKEAVRRREREKADEAETRRLRKMVEEEEKAARRRQQDIDRETERLKREYALRPPSPMNQGHRHSAPSLPLRTQQQGYLQQQQGMNRPPMPQAGPSRQSVSIMGSNGLPIMSGANLQAPPAAGQAKMKKKSFFGLRSHSSDQGNGKLAKKASAVW